MADPTEGSSSAERKDDNPDVSKEKKAFVPLGRWIFLLPLLPAPPSMGSPQLRSSTTCPLEHPIDWRSKVAKNPFAWILNREQSRCHVLPGAQSRHLVRVGLPRCLLHRRPRSPGFRASSGLRPLARIPRERNLREVPKGRRCRTAGVRQRRSRRGDHVVQADDPQRVRLDWPATRRVEWRGEGLCCGQVPARRAAAFGHSLASSGPRRAAVSLAGSRIGPSGGSGEGRHGGTGRDGRRRPALCVLCQVEDEPSLGARRPTEGSD